MVTVPDWNIKTPEERQAFDESMHQLGQSAGPVDFNNPVSPVYGTAITIPAPGYVPPAPAGAYGPNQNYVYDDTGELVPFPQSKPTSYTQAVAQPSNTSQTGSGWLFNLFGLPNPFGGPGTVAGSAMVASNGPGGLPWWVWAMIVLGVVVVLERD